MKAVVIGAGRIGCGLVGEALRASGHEVVFVARDRVMTDHLNRVGGYRLRLLGGPETRETAVDGVRAVCFSDSEQAIEELAGAQLIVSCFQPLNMPDIAPLIAAALRRRSSPVNIFAFENLFDSGANLRRLVASHLPSGWPVDDHGFSGALAGRVVSQRLGDPASGEPLTFVADHPPGFLVDRWALKGEWPRVAGMTPVDDYAAAVRQKLYIFSAGHAVAAYLGYLKGYHYIHTATHDPEIRSAVLRAMVEGRRGLVVRYGFPPAGIDSDPTRIIARFANAALDDPITRVGRDPERKLGPRDRLIGAATLAEEAGICPENLALAAAAALCFEDPHDPSSVRLQRNIRRDGVEQTLRRICRLDPNHGFGRRVADLWARLSDGSATSNLLLSLDPMLWAWDGEETGLAAGKARAAG